MKRIHRLARARPGQARYAQAAIIPVEAELRPDLIGARGDAVVNGPGGPTYVPFGLPGELVRARVSGDRAEVLEVLSPSADRRVPPCRHFGRCGGCQLQHWDEAAYLAWKRDQVVLALSRRDLGLDIEPTIAAWGEGRRRAAFHASRADGGRVKLGFIERGGARLTPIDACPVLAPGLAAMLPKLVALAEAVTPQRADVTIHCLLTDPGVDVAVKGAGKDRDRGQLEALVAIANAADIARLTIDGDTIITRRQPVLKMGGARVAPPPGAFTQPTALGEETLARLVLEALPGAARIVDLFSGIGTFALRLAEQAEVTAAESDQDMLAALKAAADGASGALKQVTIVRRDLLRTPFASLEMKKFDAAVIDPPRSGANLQAEQIARSPIRRVAYVSCDPVSFARDVRVLISHGFSLDRVTPVDQFRWSPHVEIVGALSR